MDVVWPKAVELAPVDEPKWEVIEDGWRKVRILFDTGAGASVTGKKAFPNAEVKGTAMSRAGGFYLGADGSKIYNEGEVQVNGLDDMWHGRSVIFQVADVTKPLFSGGSAAAMGFRTILDKDEKGNDCSYMEHKKTGQRTPLYLVDNVYYFDLWVKDEGFARQGNP